MKKVYIENIVTGATYKNLKIEDPTDWIAECIANNSWGLPERTFPKKGMGYDNEFDYPDILVIEGSEYEVEVEPEHERAVVEYDLDGNVVMEDYIHTDPITGVSETMQRAVVIGSETVPATFETWVRLKPEYEITEIDISTEYELKEKINRKIAVGKNIQDLSNTLIHLITGDNMESSRTAEEIAQMQVDFADINALISAGRLITAKPMIEAIENENYSELKSDILALYAMNGF